jgi:TonB-linked SusC/RagA family outer membrane protein
MSLWDTFPKFLFVTLFSLVTTLSFGQSKSITGTVVDGNNEFIIGASVVVEGTTNATITDFDGKFSLNNVANNATLRISYIGYVTQNIPIGGRTDFRIVLQEDSRTLDEVIVVGYGTVKKSDVTGSLSRVTEKQIKERPVQNAVQALQGKATGVDITSSSRPGELGTIRVRGNRSINASNEPLYVVDGIPLTSSSVINTNAVNNSSALSVSMTTNPMADINPNDIASIEILKDASATAIYGSRGANGVVLVTTKKGTTGKVSINYDGTVTFNRIDALTDWMNAGDLLNWQRSRYINGGTYGGAYGNAPDPDRDMRLFMNNESYMSRILATAYQLDADGKPLLRQATEQEKAKGYADQVPIYNSANLFDQHWADLVTRTGITNNHQLSLSSGTEKSKLYFSFAYLNQESPMVDQGYERYTANINGEIAPSKWLKIGTSINASHAIQNYGMINNGSENGGAKDSYGQALGLMPYAPAYDENGNILKPDRGKGLSEHNVLRNINSGTNENRVYSLMNSTYGEITFTPWLKYRMNFGAQYRGSRNGSFYDSDFSNPVGSSPAASEPRTGYNRTLTSFSWVLENLLYVDKTWREHTIGITALQSAQKFRREEIWMRSQGLLYSSALWYSMSANSFGKPHGYDTGFTENSIASYMGRVNYSFKNRYLFTATGRWDGASVLAKGHKWDFFPSLALAWKLEEESFIKDIRWFDQLKLRFGWGVTGNSAVGAYSTTGSMAAANQVFNDVQISGAKASVMPNYDLGWEKTSQSNFGLDFGFLSNRISGSIEYYQSQTSDLLMSRSIPAILGYASIQTNIGKTQNKGLEISLSTVNIQTKDFRWSTDFNWSRNKEKIIELANGKQDDKANGWFIGQPIAVMRDYKYERLWQDTPEDQRLMQIYKVVGNVTSIPGQVKVVDQQPMIEVPAGTEGSKTYTLASEEKINIMDNGFGKIDDDDAIILGSNRPDWVAGMTNTFVYKNWQFNFFVHARIGNLYYGLLQTYGRRVEKDVWSPENSAGRYPRPTTETFTGYSDMMNYAKGNMLMVRNIALSYTLPNKILTKYGLGNAQVYAQVLNPFIFGSDLVKAGINPDDVNGWSSKAEAGSGGQTNNTALMRSYVIGIRLGF